MTARDLRTDAGSVTLFFTITVIGLLLMVGLVADGGAKVRGIQNADALAADAARVAGQSINTTTAIPGNPPTVNRSTAIRAATTYLTRHGATGTVTITNGGRTVSVETTATVHTVFLSLIGISTFTVHGHAGADLVRGVTGAQP